MPGGGTEPQGEVCFHWPRKLGVGSADAQIMPGAGSQGRFFPVRQRNWSPSRAVNPFRTESELLVRNAGYGS